MLFQDTSCYPQVAIPNRACSLVKAFGLVMPEWRKRLSGTQDCFNLVFIPVPSGLFCPGLVFQGCGPIGGLAIFATRSACGLLTAVWESFRLPKLLVTQWPPSIVGVLKGQFDVTSNWPLHLGYLSLGLGSKRKGCL